MVEGKRKLEDQAVDRDAQEQLRGFRVAIEPNGASCFFTRLERALAEGKRIDFAIQVHQRGLTLRGDLFEGLMRSTSQAAERLAGSERTEHPVMKP
jgi:hypothetical protein